jgi:LCP family protein required for cell wall assembly
VISASLTAGVAASWLQKTAAQVVHNDPAEVRSASGQLSPVLPSQPLNVLIIGSDRRLGQPSVGARSDTLIVVRLDPKTKSISMLSVPRDLLVDIPGYGPNKINAAYSYGGAKLSLEVVKHLLGVPINDFIDVNFEGFVGVVDKLGGSYLMIDHRYYNNTAVTDYASIDIEPGYQLLNGHQTLDFVRFRHDQDGDFTRIVRQQMFLREMKRQLAASATITSFPRLFSVATIMSHYVVSDIASLNKIYGLVTLALQLNSNHIYQTHIDGSTPTINGIDYVVATPQQIGSAVQQFLHPTGAPVLAQPKPSVSQLPRSKARVVVLNGSGQPGAARSVASQLQTRGYAATVAGNAANFDFTQTVVTTAPDAESVGRGIAKLLGPAQVNVSNGVPAGQISVTMGSSFLGQLTSASTSQAATATQAIASGVSQGAAQWQALQRQAHLSLYMPTAWSPGLGYEQFRAYRVRVGHRSVRAAVVVGTTPQGGYWDVQALRWTDPPILANPDQVRTIGGRSYSLYYDDAALHLVAWRVGATVYWVSNTLDDELSNPVMLALATSTVPVKG